MTPEEKRFIEAGITQRFLHDNAAIVGRIIEKFGSVMRLNMPGEAAGYNFYLKGGNSISILNNEEVTGDFDFQLMPPHNEYNNWPQLFDNVDNLVLGMLKKTVEDTAADIENMPPPKLGFNIDCFKVENLQSWARGNLFNEKIIDLSGLLRHERLDKILLIGRNFGDSSYKEIIKNPNFNNGRLEVENSFKSDKFNEIGTNFGPSVYVNYTIPGFILYRMVYSYRYSIGGESFNLKSEIIDVSVPRKGSAEVYMSQEGAVTHFRDSGLAQYPFKIPGWGYHFYENLNLIQENFLNISASPQKLDKRINRFKLAMQKLQDANRGTHPSSINQLLKNNINEPANNHTTSAPYTAIKGYLGAMEFNVFDYNGKYNQYIIYKLIGPISFHILNSYNIANNYWEANIEDWKRLTYFRLSREANKTVSSVSIVKSCIIQFMINCKPAMILNRTYQFITPLMDLEDIDFPFDYVVIEVINDSYNIFRDYCKRKTGSQFYEEFHNNAFSCWINEPQTADRPFKRKFALIVQRCPGDKLPANVDITDQFLLRCILESQRHPLAQHLETMNNKSLSVN